MPAINVRFEQEELDRLRAHADAQGRSLQHVIHDAALSEAGRHDLNAAIANEAAYVIAHSQQLLARLADK